MKYRPQYPEKPFKNLAMPELDDNFVNWYNNSNLHSGINFVTPSSRHDGDHLDILAKRHKVYIDAKAKHPRVGLERQETGILLGGVFKQAKHSKIR